MQNCTPLLTLSVVATGAIAAQSFASPTGGQATAGGNAMGVARYAANQAGDKVPVDVIGTTVVLSGAALTPGSLVEVGAGGLAVPKNTGVAVARVAPGDSAPGAGAPVEVILLPN